MAVGGGRWRRPGQRCGGWDRQPGCWSLVVLADRAATPGEGRRGSRLLSGRWCCLARSGRRLPRCSRVSCALVGAGCPVHWSLTPTAAHQTGQDAVSGQSMCRFGTVAVLSPDSASRSHRLGTNGTRSGVSMPCRNNRCPRLPTGLWDGGVCTETASRLFRNDNPASSRSRWTAASAQTVNRRTAAEPGSSQDPRTPLPIAALSASTPDNQQPGRQLEHSDCLPHHRGTCDR